MDLVINCVQNRFDQPGYKVLRNVEELLLKSVRSDFEDYSEEFTFVTEFYAKDIDKDSLKVQLETLKTYFENQTSAKVKLSDIFGYMRELAPAMRSIYSEIVTLVRILLVIPASNATSERTFSALRRVKTYLRSTMAQTRMNTLIALHVHKDRTDALDLKAIANEFIDRNDRRRCVFGKF